MRRRTPLTPIFNAKVRKGAIVVGNTPGAPIVQITIVDVLSLAGASGVCAVASGVICVASEGDDAVYSVDVSDPTAMVVLDSLVRVPATATEDLNNPGLPSLFGTSVLVGGRTAHAVNVLDFSTPAALTVTGSVVDASDLDDPLSVVAGSGEDYALSPQFGGGGATVVDISTPASPTVVGSIATGTDLPPGSAQAAALGSLSAAVACQDRVTTVDYSTPASPVVADSVTDAALDGVETLARIGSTLFAASYNNNTIVAIDASNIAALSVIDTFTNAALDGPGGLAAYGNYLIVASIDGSSVLAIDASNPAAMSVVASVVDVADLASPVEVAVLGDHAYVTADDRIVAVDLSGLP